jgi:hypothetical protein
MSGSDGVGFDRLPILVELREQLNQHYRASASSPREQPLCVRARRWRPLALIAVLVLGGATGALAAAGVFTPSVIQRASTYISPGAMRAVNSPLCAPRPLTMATGTPPASLLSILGVLRRPERTGGIPDVLSRRLVPPKPVCTSDTSASPAQPIGPTTTYRCPTEPAGSGLRRRTSAAASLP